MTALHAVFDLCYFFMSALAACILMSVCVSFFIHLTIFVLKMLLTHTNVSGSMQVCSTSSVLVLLAGLYQWYQMADLLRAAIMA